MIIYPPYIADTIPAFTTEKIIIPFQENQAVHPQYVTGFRLIVKNYQSSKIEATLSINKDETFFINNEIIFTSDPEKGFATIKADEYWKPTMSQYYKFQLAYDDGTDYFAYSSVSIGRCIGKAPTISIGQKNTYLYQGEYVTSLISEPIYSYRFILSNSLTNTIIYDSGDILHNVDNDTIDYNTNTRISTHDFAIKYEYNSMNLKYIITTINGYTQYAILDGISFINANIEDKPYLKISQDEKAKSNAYVKIELNDIGDDFFVTNKNYIIERKKVTNDKWEEMIQFKIANLYNINLFAWKDYAIEQGVSYQYAIKDQNNRYIINTTITTDFEDSFLLDTERQLNIKYNTKISNFKNNILEQKMETIGSQYPFFFRNGQVNYKEFSISGLLSYLMDEDETFISKYDLGLIQSENTNLTSNNILAERNFKLTVLEWLNNGKPKLFKSPTEGVYLVRLTNVSLSPNDTLGRMLHAFTATAYEIGNHEIETLIKNSIINFSNSEEQYSPSSALGLFVIGASSLG